MLIWYILCMSGTWKTDLCPSPLSNGEKWWYDVPRILTKFMNVNVIHKNAKVWCQIHSYIKDQKRQTVILTLFIYAKTVILSFLYLEILMVRNEYDTDCRSKKMILILWNFETLYRDTLWNFQNNNVVSPGHKMLTPYIFVGLVVFYFWHRTCICYWQTIKIEWFFKCLRLESFRQCALYTWPGTFQEHTPVA